jgi:hypothetical protein
MGTNGSAKFSEINIAPHHFISYYYYYHHHHHHHNHQLYGLGLVTCSS